jgi:hypothetical protein
VSNLVHTVEVMTCVTMLVVGDLYGNICLVVVNTKEAAVPTALFLEAKQIQCLLALKG